MIPDDAGRQPVVEGGAGQHSRRDIHLHGLPVVEKQELPVGTADGDGQEGVLFRHPLQFEGAARDDGAVNRSPRRLVDKVNARAVLRRMASRHGISHIV